MLDLELDLRTVRYKHWKAGGDMKLFYREAQRKEVPEKEGKKEGEGEGERGSGGEEDKQEEKTESKQERTDR